MTPPADYLSLLDAKRKCVNQKEQKQQMAVKNER